MTDRIHLSDTIHLLTDEEEERIQASISSDPDAPELTNEQIANARPFADVFPALAESIKRASSRDG